MTPDPRDDLAFRRERNAARQRAPRTGVEPIPDAELDYIEHCIAQGRWPSSFLRTALVGLIARLRAAEADKRTLIAALRVNAMRLPTYPGHKAFDRAVAQMLAPGQAPPDDARARGEA